MTIATKIKNFLKEKKVKYEVLCHQETFTSQQFAQAQHVPGQNVIKVLIVKEKENYEMLLLPASYKVEFEKLKNIFKNEELKLASEEELKKIFPDCEIGAMPPFGNLYNLPVYLDQSLTEDKEIIFQAGTHKDAIKMKYKDFIKLVKPKIEDFAIHE